MHFVEMLKQTIRDRFPGVNRLMQIARYGSPRAQKIEFLLNEVIELRAQNQQLLAAINLDRGAMQAKDSFSHQWQELTHSRHLIGDPDFERNMVRLVESYTGLSQSWFKGRTVLDVGCGNGRWSHAFVTLGAKVTAVDQSKTGIDALRKTAEERGVTIEAKTADILDRPLFPGAFDFVWCFGVVHHTGDTRKAIEHVAAAVRPCGMLYLMVYGPPKDYRDFVEANAYGRLRRETMFMSFDEKIAYLNAHYPADQVQGWFDAISPDINDTHTFEELRNWLTALGFVNIRRTVATQQHHHIIAERGQ
jgi:2-polyprenyl-3-methyl-5-hydroxy-6-metoxy-1,4-benzoquinol methylase